MEDDGKIIRLNRKVRVLHADGDVYEAEWKDDEVHKNRKYIHTNEVIYEANQ